MRVQLVRARVSEERRESYLRAWKEWSGTLFGMGIRAELLESEEDPERFVEVTWLDAGTEGALADDRLVRAAQALGVASHEREGALDLYERVVVEP